jgi:hypothetical protein
MSVSYAILNPVKSRSAGAKIFKQTFNEMVEPPSDDSITQ